MHVLCLIAMQKKIQSNGIIKPDFRCVIQQFAMFGYSPITAGLWPVI